MRLHHFLPRAGVPLFFGVAAAAAVAAFAAFAAVSFFFFAAAAFVITRVVGQINTITRLTESEITDGCPNTVETVPMAAYESYLRVDDPRRWRRLDEELALTKQS